MGTLGIEHIILVIIVIAGIGYFIKGRPQPKDIFVEETPPKTRTNSQPTTQSASKWISTKDRSPEYYKSVVIHTVDGDTLYSWARVNDGKEDYYIHPTDNRTIVPNEVTHWMMIDNPNS